METKILVNGTAATVAFIGRLDTPSATQVDALLREQVMNEEVIDALIDCEQLSYISSSGLRILISMHKYCLRKGGQLTIRNIASDIKEVLDMTGFTHILHIE